MDITIQPISAEYAEKNRLLMNQIILESHFLARREPVSQEKSDGFLRSVLKNPNTFYLVALVEQNVVGHFLALPRAEELISHIASIGYLVHPDYRKRGIATSLLKELVNLALERTNLEILTAEVIEDNLSSVNFLLKNDFQKIGRIKKGVKINSQYLDLILFSKSLTK